MRTNRSIDRKKGTREVDQLGFTRGYRELVTCSEAEAIAAKLLEKRDTAHKPKPKPTMPKFKFME